MSATQSLATYQRHYKIALTMGYSKGRSKLYAAGMANNNYETLGQNIREIK